MDIKEIAKGIKREEFLEEVSEENSKFECPSNDGLKDDCSHMGYQKEGCKECWRQATKDIKFKDDLEDNKVEDKTIKVRCIDNSKRVPLTIKKEYDVILENEMYYMIIDDEKIKREYFKNRFEEVKEDILMVECIDNKLKSDELSIGNKYIVIKVKAKGYIIKNDYEEEQEYNSWRFKPVPKEKEQKEFTFTEVMFLKDREKYKSEFREISRQNNMITISDADGKSIMINLDAKFTKVEEPKSVSTVEAFKALEEGKKIQSVLTSNRYKKDGNELICNLPVSNKYEDTLYIEYREIENQWLIIE